MLYEKYSKLEGPSKVIFRCHVAFWLLVLTSGFISAGICRLIYLATGGFEGNIDFTPIIVLAAVHLIIFCGSFVLLLYTARKRGEINKKYKWLGIGPFFIHILIGLLTFIFPGMFFHLFFRPVAFLFSLLN